MQMTIEEVITESLEADNLQLQNMSTSKYVQVTCLYCSLSLAWTTAFLGRTYPALKPIDDSLNKSVGNSWPISLKICLCKNAAASCILHPRGEIWVYYKSTGRAHAKVLYSEVPSEHFTIPLLFSMHSCHWQLAGLIESAP